MTKTNKILIGLLLISCLFLGVGYAAIENITLDINGTVLAKPTTSTLMTGEEFNKKVKGSTSTSTSDTKITKIVFDYWEYGYLEGGTQVFCNADWNSGTAIDVDGKGRIRLFKSADGTKAYILSPSKIMANSSCAYMFQYFSNVTEIIFNNFNTSSVTSMHAMFRYMSSLKNVDLSEFNTSKVHTMQYMFEGVSSIQELNLSNFDTKNVISMGLMFYGMTSLKKLDVSTFITTKVEGMNQMFYNCNKLTSLDLSSFSDADFNNLNLFEMFRGMSSLTYLDFSNYDLSKAKGYWNMGYGVPKNVKIIVKDEISRQWLKNTSGAQFSSATIILASEL